MQRRAAARVPASASSSVGSVGRGTSRAGATVRESWNIITQGHGTNAHRQLLTAACEHGAAGLSSVPLHRHAPVTRGKHEVANRNASTGVSPAGGDAPLAPGWICGDAPTASPCAGISCSHTAHSDVQSTASIAIRLRCHWLSSTDERDLSSGQRPEQLPHSISCHRPNQPDRTGDRHLNRRLHRGCFCAGQRDMALPP